MDILLYIILGVMVLAFILNNLWSSDDEKEKPHFSKSGREERKSQFWMELRWGLGTGVVLSVIWMAMEQGWV